MRTVAEHRAVVLSLVEPLPAERVAVGSALGRVLAEDAVAAVDLPGFDNSAMDGYAVRAADLAGPARTPRSSCPSTATSPRATPRGTSSPRGTRCAS